jgi:thioredoxin-related protein
MKIIYLIFVFLLTINTALSRDGFILDSFTEAKTLSKKTKRPVLLIFGADYCNYCSLLKTDILSNKLSPEVDNYIVCYIDLKEMPNFKNDYGVSIIPDSRIIVDDMEISSTKGYGNRKYRSWLQNVK